ncbi:HET-domain-containing protein [Plenodomus tracheiphilus IPT5]|uniref:HET-domain-containing protein n=1 Tax=Plenodomus tracheiphilus IPT5 TaxID=1408161 RepID=A0A6A7BBL4_9PLEO|nr:HET-domain-containing protein [Plenodomus tracheiphilus IPT5]
MSTVYDCDPLSNGPSTTFRLLKLSPDYSWTTYRPLLSITTHISDVNHPPLYTALSYVWGDPTPTKSILLNGHTVLVRRNLWDFLQKARKWQCTGYLWIDALSIDQSSIAERNHQVAIMGDIYRNAAKTIAWLGPGTRSLSKDIRRLTASTFQKRNHSSNDDNLFGRLRYHVPTLQCEDARDRVFALRSLLSHEELQGWCAVPDYGRTAQEMYEDMSYSFRRRAAQNDPIKWSVWTDSLQQVLGLGDNDEVVRRVTHDISCQMRLR